MKLLTVTNLNKAILEVVLIISITNGFLILLLTLSCWFSVLSEKSKFSGLRFLWITPLECRYWKKNLISCYSQLY